jgi:beta-glucosidase/6-phospho-beta-glucosidase/beta-galactosidase
MKSFLDKLHELKGGGSPDDLAARAGAFMFATGIECSYPKVDGGRMRRDLLEECGHYERWREDLDLVKAMGLRYLRYGLPYHRTHLGPGRYDWSFADEVMEGMRARGIVPILDLLHFGVPDWLGNFQNPDLPTHFAEYAEAVAQRYPWVKHWTPVNEIYVAARVSAKDGFWNEQLKSDRAFVTALKHLVAASLLAGRAILRHRPDALLIQSESAEYFHELRAIPSRANRIANAMRFVSLDLLYGNPPDAEIYRYLLENGLTKGEFDWFMGFDAPGHQVLGLDYYGRNERLLKPNGGVVPAEDVLGWYQLARQYYRRYRKPLMHTETNVFDKEAAPGWLWKQWINVLRLRGDGIPVLGFTWYSLIDQIDWDTELREKNDRVVNCGLYDLDRKPNPVAQDYRDLLAEYGGIGPVVHAGFLAPADLPAQPRPET